MSYSLLRTDKANDQLFDIIQYIARDSGNTDTAMAYLEHFEVGISRLKEFPRSGHIPRYAILKKQGYLVLTIQRHLVFYKVIDLSSTVIIYAIVDARQDYMKLL
jgi:toxin ParE1/3/4